MEMIENIRNTFIDMLQQSSWMDPMSKSKAIEKARAINEAIGYPDYLGNENLTKLETDYAEYNFNSSLMSNGLIILRLEMKKNVLMFREPVDRKKWAIPPTIVEATYTPQYNRISIGMFIGHEITHGFDDFGRQYDKDGNRIPWWTNETINKFNERKQCIIDQYDQYTVTLAGTELKMNGTQTQGENIADNGGLKEAFFTSLTMTITYTSNSSSIIILILIGICLSLIALITALGNIIVLLAFYCDKKLRTINDYFILNMAIADFLVGCFCIPFYIPFSITRSWPFGRLFCKIWVTIDDVATMASVINIVAISINRYWSIAYPISYRKYVKQHFVYLVMGAVWCLSFLNFAPGIWLLSLFNNNNNTITRSDCSGDYNYSFVYMLIAQFNYFIWPFIALCIFNMLIMLNIWKRSRKMNRLTSFSQSIKSKERKIGSLPIVTSKYTKDDQCLSILSKKKINSIENCPSKIAEEKSDNIDQFILVQLSSSNKNLPNSFDENNKSSNNCQHTITYLSPVIQQKSSIINKNDLKQSRKSSSMVYLSRKCASVSFSHSNSYRNDSFGEYRLESDIEVSKTILSGSSSSKHLNTTTTDNNKFKEYRRCGSKIIRDRKAARSLFILVIVFLIFLFPYVICAIVSTAGVNISGIILEVSFWLLWLNSTCNPFLYPFIQIQYRRAYLKLFFFFRTSFILYYLVIYLPM
ncbi:unnamed protein product, partial [Rotaria sp. Silwood1]